MKEKVIRCLRADEIEIRVAQITDKGVQLLLYKDSRCDKRILDETFGVNGWKNKYEEIKGNLFCTISIWDDEKKQWIDKCDCGVESFSEKEKGEASDAFKRAGFNIGIGRELYTRLYYFANIPTKQVGTDKNGKPKYDMVSKYEKFYVSKIETNEMTEKIEKIEIIDSKKNVVFSYGFSKSKTDSTKLKMEDGQLQSIRILLNDNEDFKKQIYQKLQISHSEELLNKYTKDQATKLIRQIKALKTKYDSNK